MYPFGFFPSASECSPVSKNSTVHEIMRHVPKSRVATSGALLASVACMWHLQAAEYPLRKRSNELVSSVAIQEMNGGR
jgi:hypothetical protein